MKKRKNTLLNAAEFIEDNWDELRFKIKKRLGLNDPVQVVPFRTYGTTNHIYCKGRIIEDKKISNYSEKDTIVNNLINMYKRFESDEVPGAQIRLQLAYETQDTIADKEGYFIFYFCPLDPIQNDQQWHTFSLHLINAPIPFDADRPIIAEMLIPSAEAEYGIISDIYDTVIKTKATSLLAMSRNTFFNNAKTRLPFAGVSEFYKSLQLGRNGKRNNPFFYVSSSPWNLYDLLIDFLDLNEIPAGPLLLRDFGFDLGKMEGHLHHKIHEIRQILENYPELPFILIGDSGQEDPAIYQEVVKQFPGRILAIYIRDVQIAPRKKNAQAIALSLKEQNVDMIIVDNTVEAAAHAAKSGFIFTEAISAIEQDKKEDLGQIPGKKKMNPV